MPFTYTRDNVRRRITVTWSGTFSRTEIIDMMNRLCADGTWPFAVLNDARGLAGAAEQDDVRALVAHAVSLRREHGKRGPMATVTTDPAQFGTGRMYEALTQLRDDSFEIGMFR